MSLPNPVYALIVPFLFVFTIPLAILATITTTFAISILFFRAILIYIELALAVIPYYLLGLSSSSQKASLQLHKPNSTSHPAPRRRKRRSSTSSNISGGTITPVPGDAILALSQSIGPTRDFEGVGGWRGDASDDDSLWTNINSRLELPAHHERRHHRSLTGELGERSFNSESMNTARARTPPTLGTMGERSFPQITTSQKLKRSPSGNTGTSTSSGNSKASSTVLSMKQM